MAIGLEVELVPVGTSSTRCPLRRSSLTQAKHGPEIRAAVKAFDKRYPAFDGCEHQTGFRHGEWPGRPVWQMGGHLAYETIAGQDRGSHIFLCDAFMGLPAQRGDGVPQPGGGMARVHGRGRDGWVVTGDGHPGRAMAGMSGHVARGAR